MKWSEQAWKSCESVFTDIVNHPFVKELMEGTLPREKFTFYLQQDANYLSEYGKILAAIASRMDRKDWREDFLSFSGDTVSVEQALHGYYLNDMGPLKPESPSCLLYIGHMHRELNSGNIESALAAVLPCFWVYKEVGDYISAHQKKGNNPYQNWIDTYGGEEFALAVEKALTICDSAAEETTGKIRTSMTRAFALSFRMEYMFWDSAYRKEQWPV